MLTKWIPTKLQQKEIYCATHCPWDTKICPNDFANLVKELLLVCSLLRISLFVFLLKTKLDICNDRCSRDLSDLSVRGRTILGSARRAFINRASLTVPCPTHIYHPLSYSCNIPFKASSIFPRACSYISSWTRVCYSHTESLLDFVWSLMLVMRCFLL